MTSARCLLHVPTYLSRCVMVYTCVYRPTCARWPSLLRSLSFCHYFAIAPVTFRGRYRIISLLFSLSYTHFSSNSFTVAYNGFWGCWRSRWQSLWAQSSLQLVHGGIKITSNLISTSDSKYCKNKREHVGSSMMETFVLASVLRQHVLSCCSVRSKRTPRPEVAGTDQRC